MRNGIVLSLAATLALLTASPSPAAANLDLSKSNINRIVYSVGLIKADQVPLLLAELDKLGAATKTQLEQWLPENLERFGVDLERLKKTVVLLKADPGRPSKGAQRGQPNITDVTTILLLSDPADENAAMALATSVHSSKSKNSSD